MREENVEIRTADGTIDAVVFHPEHVRGAVLHLPDAGGVRPSQKTRAARTAELGYTVLLPNFFYRSGKPPFFDFQPKAGDPRTAQRLAELSAPFTPDAIERDIRAYADFLSGPIAIVAHCFSGQLALRMAAAHADRVVTAASFHGGGLCTDAPSSPHLVLPKVKAQLYFGHASGDPSMPKEAIEKLESALKTWGGRFESETYQGASHGWTTLDSPVYNPEQSDRAFAKLSQLLDASFASSS